MKTRRRRLVYDEGHSRMDDITPEHSRNLDVFAFLWAWASIIHQAKLGLWALDGLDIVMTCAAALVIARPGSLANFLTLVVIQLADLLVKLPDLNNHPVVMLLSDMVIVAAIVREIWLRPSTPIDKGSLFDSFAPVLRVMAVVVYFWATFHKLNWDYLDPTYSAAVVHYEHLVRLIARFGLQLPTLEWAKYGAIYGTLVIESAIPILLVFARTRIAGLWVGLLFHLMLAIENYHDFSAVAYAMLFLFTPANFLDLMAEWWQKSLLGRISARVAKAAILRPIPIQVWLAVLASIAFGTFNHYHVFRVLAVVFDCGCIVAFAGAIHGRTSAVAERTNALKLVHPAFVIFPLLALFNGACPYLGLKTRSCFAMFSNLRTEGGRTNHLLVPTGLQIAGFQQDMIRIVESSDPFIAGIAERGSLIPFFNLRTYISAKANRGETGTYVKYMRGEQVVTVTNAEKDEELSRPYPIYMRKLLLFGETNPGPHQPIRH